VLSLLRQREEKRRGGGGGGEKHRHTVSGSHFTPSPPGGGAAVCIQTAGHHIATLRLSGRFQLIAICGAVGVSLFVGTNVSEHCLFFGRDLQVK